MAMSSASFSESRFWKHIGWILIVKIAAISMLWWFFFGPDHRIKPNAALIQSQLIEGKQHD